MSYDLSNQNISSTFINLLQRRGSRGHLYDLQGNKVDNLTIDGTLTATSYIVSESLVSYSEGSTIFGNTSDDTHKFIGHVSSSIVSASVIYFGDGTLDLSHEELLNRDYYRGRFAAHINGKVIYNWDEYTIG